MLEWPDETIYRGIAAVADRSPDAPAIYFEGTETTYGELLAESEALARGLSALGVGPGDFLAVWLGNRPEWITAQLAASALGAAVVAVNTRYRRHELEYLLDDAECRAVLTESTFLGTEYLDTLGEFVPELRTHDPGAFTAETVPSLETVVAIDPPEEFPAVRAYGELLDPGPVDPYDDNTAPAAVFYTSGTTSDPKGCLQSSRSLLNHSHQVGVHFDVGDDVAIGMLPFCGIWGYNVFLSALSHGIPLVVQSHFDAERAIELIESHDVSYCSGLATMFRRMLASDEFAPERVDSVERGAVGFVSDGYDEALFERIESAFGFPLVQPYGLSEANSQIFVGEPTAPVERRKRVGGPLIHPDSGAKVVDPETGDTQPPGEEGELYVRGYNVMNRYLGKPEATEAAFVDGWLRTGDLAVRDESGSFYYRSRLDDAIRVRGFLLAPRELEAAIETHPDVAAAAVVGIDHSRHGTVPIAYVVGEDADADVDVAELRAYLEDRIADYKVPDEFVVVDSFPRSEGPHGRKIRKTELRDRAVERFGDGD